MTLPIRYSTEDNQLTIMVKGVFDFHLVGAFREAYTGIAPTVEKIVIDFKGVEHIDSSGLGMLLNLRKTFARTSIEIALINCRDEVRQVLLNAQFDKVFTVN
ncbi:anti-sigma factor antagonist [Aliidiomarina taiwanensis]|uniref:Anti-sigma factor antagonist n=1 Tax=Aliidiomarina taiwanensis TaxID=946228 RepID=A0A432X1Q6_9GAMM|nr:STAS domain-containing protein [Aliidiomarina taiwanensis]RUO40511.1 anti-sigma factor antagonist [Aliidiomarina taiwanensis]